MEVREDDNLSDPPGACASVVAKMPEFAGESMAGTKRKETSSVEKNLERGRTVIFSAFPQGSPMEMENMHAFPLGMENESEFIPPFAQAPSSSWMVVSDSSLCWIGLEGTECVDKLDLIPYFKKLIVGASNEELCPYFEHHSMKVGRVEPILLALDRRLYVLGGILLSDISDSSPWGEVFDLDSGSWNTFPTPKNMPSFPPPQLEHFPNDNCFWGAIPPNEILVVTDTFEAYRFNLETNECCKSDIPKPPFLGAFGGSGILVSSSTLLWITTRGYLLAFDMESKEWIHSNCGIRDDVFDCKPDECWRNPFLAHVNAYMFCVIWADWDRVGHSTTSIYCQKLYVSREPGKRLLTFEVLECERKAISSYSHLTGAMVIDGILC